MDQEQAVDVFYWYCFPQPSPREHGCSGCGCTFSVGKNVAGGCAQKVMELNLVGSWLQGVLLLGSYSSSQCCLMSLSMRYMKGLSTAVVRLQKCLRGKKLCRGIDGLR